MKKQSKKLLAWEVKDYVRTISWFALHTLIFVLGFVAILYINSGFSFVKIAESRSTMTEEKLD